MKKVLLVIAAVTGFSTLYADQTIRLNGTKVGTETSTTVGTDGSVTLKANCNPSASECASVTVSSYGVQNTERVAVSLYNSDGTTEEYTGIRFPGMTMVIGQNALEVQYYPR